MMLLMYDGVVAVLIDVISLDAIFTRFDVKNNNLFSILPACRGSLREMLMAKCLNLTDNAVECVISLCPIIDILVFHSCPLMSERSRYGSHSLFSFSLVLCPKSMFSRDEATLYKSLYLSVCLNVCFSVLPVSYSA